MSNNYSPGKRQREAEQQRRRKEKEQQRAARRERGPAQIEIVDASEIQGSLPSIESALHAIENRGSESRSAAGVPARLFVGGLSDDTTEQDLVEAFGAYGPVADVIVMIDRGTRMSRGFGFVTMADRRDASKAIEALEGTVLKGRTLVVNVATDRR